MYQHTSILFLIMMALLLGLRHGIDWDHIVAISDITSSVEEKRKGLLLGLLYILGHASVIIILGILSVALGVTLPGWVDSVMERVVGVTLVILGIWLLVSIMVHGHSFKMKSGRIFLIEQSIRLYNLIHDMIPHAHKHKEVNLMDGLDKRTAYIIGIIHGIGAETPTQVLLFVSAAGVGRGLVGITLVIVFVLGLMMANFFISYLSLKGFEVVEKKSNLRLVLGTITGVISLVVGILFLLNKATVLPVILGG